MNEKDAFLILNAVSGIGNSGVQRLLKRHGSAAKVLSLSEADLLGDPKISSKTIQNILHFPKDKFLKIEYNLMEKKQVRVITWLDDDYPELLRQIADAPVILYVKGELSLDNTLLMAIVGSRRASFYGESTSGRFAVRFAELGFTVVSGMARGIDTAAHRGALKAGGATIAVLGCGLSRVYPPENKKLLEEIADCGAIISEFPMEEAPLAYNFPRRNRIISGLSLGVIVVEAAERSGALITADFALEQGREVFAVPGKIDHSGSRGVHNLIKQGAKLVTSVDDILEDMQPRVSAYLNDNKNRLSETQQAGVPEMKSWVSGDRGTGDQSKELSTEEKIIFDHITDRPVHIDELTHHCGPTVPVMSVLLQLELKHLVKQLPGKLFVNESTT
ncbi:MAG: DNA-processing protein DprA [Candidatus Omnitrophica bacterium]|nr:DNA-processing protein DprA [Candidatus Omnitrophota bacterium]